MTEDIKKEIENATSEQKEAEATGDHKEEIKKESEREDKIQELTDSLQRLQAEFENYQKFAEKEKAESGKYAKAQLIGTLLPCIDAFSMALTHTKNPEKFVEGMKLIHEQILLTLGNEGLTPIQALGKEFDPHLHEVMMKKPSEEKEGVIIDEVQPGFMLGERVLRHSKVIVSGEATESKENGAEQKKEVKDEEE